MGRATVLLPACLSVACESHAGDADFVETDSAADRDRTAEPEGPQGLTYWDIA